MTGLITLGPLIISYLYFTFRGFSPFQLTALKCDDLSPSSRNFWKSIQANQKQRQFCGPCVVNERIWTPHLHYTLVQDVFFLMVCISVAKSQPGCTCVTWDCADRKYTIKNGESKANARNWYYHPNMNSAVMLSCLHFFASPIRSDSNIYQTLYELDQILQVYLCLARNIAPIKFSGWSNSDKPFRIFFKEP